MTGMDGDGWCGLVKKSQLLCTARTKGGVRREGFGYFPPEVLNRMRPPRATAYPGGGAVRN